MTCGSGHTDYVMDILEMPVSRRGMRIPARCHVVVRMGEQFDVSHLSVLISVLSFFLSLLPSAL